MSIRKIRKAGQQKVFMACTYGSNGVFIYHMRHGKKRFPHIIPKPEKGLAQMLDLMQRKKKVG